MAINLTDSIRVGQQKPVEDKYFNGLVPYTSVTNVNSLINKNVRHRGLTVNINGEEYWYKDGIEDGDLVFKSNQKTIEVNILELKYGLIYQKKLEPGRLYKITEVEGWCFSGHLIKAIYLKAITNDTLESEGLGEFYTPKYDESDSNLGIWKGELLANGMISSASYNIGDKVIWGNLFWENISGNIGTNEKEIEGSDSLKIDNYLSESDWRLITPTDEESLYNIQFDTIKYDIENNYINYRADNLGNVYEITYNRLLTINPNYIVAINKDTTFIYYLNAISLFQWGRDNVYNNIINESFVSNCNYNPTAFYDNTIDNSMILENNFLNVSIIGNYFKNASIARNYLKTYGGLLYNNLENSSISLNKYYFEISYNNLKYDSSIYGNNDNNIIVGGKFSRIKGNNLDNSGKIKNNIFVEEGKSNFTTIKGIYNNNVKGISTISGNTIKNSSSISDNELNNADEINGNNLDTDSNIYRNFLKSACKINGHILTGHGRIYGNTLYRQGEITNCKLRISPASSYASGIHSNEIWSGKIDNIDFGNIVNPVGTNPNDPAFGGSSLDNCIIKNKSIIKDLILPDSGGVGLQFIKMNGASEFKNITVNDSIRSVEFINTVFDETSDYSKIIQGADYGGVGFTKYYLDNVLLQDRFDEKQDVLTEDNVGQFMDVKLSTKSTPTSGDTVLGKDSLTGKAVEIPTSSLGGNGNVDTSNLVPYNGANKDVNIASNYFKTSKGFKLEKDLDNYFITHYYGDYNLLEFSSKDISIDNFGEVRFRVNPDEGFVFQKYNDTGSNTFQVITDSTYSAKPFVSDVGFKTTNGTASQYLMANGSTSTLPTDLIKGTGVINYLTKISSSGTIGNSQIFDDGTNVGIGTINPINKFTILGADDNLPNLGTSSGKLGIFNGVFGNPTYGLLQGVLGTGSSYIQSQRVDGTAVAYDLLLQPSGGNVSIGGITTPSEKLEVGGYTKATGFKTPTGTANQSLTANGDVFDLDTKADLDGGKVPASQLPSYVDDVLEFANLASFPATGENGKIYIAIDTNLTYRWGGSSYVVMSSSLALGETSSTAYRGDRGKIAYDHSQTTGNAHNTKVEELTDVSGDATSIADTDIILKKEIGGLWKKISWTNIKANLKTYFDDLYAPKSFNLKVTTPSSWVTGTMSETEVFRIEIPANSISDNSFLNMPILFINKIGTNGTLFIRGKLSTSPTMPSGDPLFQSNVIAATNQYVGLDRIFLINSGAIKGLPSGFPSYSASTVSNSQVNSKPFDRTVTNYLYISITLGNSADQARLEGIQLTNS